MSIDFDSAALQTQHEEEEYDQEDYAREQELHKLLTDLPDDMLEDSRDSSSPELEYSTCSNKNTGNSYNPHHPAHQPKMFNSQAAHQGGQFDHLQREFLDSTQRESYEQLAQLQILNQAHQRQIEDLERKLEDSRRNMRYLEHQFAIVKDEKDGQAVSLKESGRLVEEAKEREVQMQNKVKAMEQQIQVLTERDHENMKKQRVAEAAVDSMKQQMLELCRSDTLSRAREQHDRDLTIIREQHDVSKCMLTVLLYCCFQTDVGLRLREQVKQLERQREEEQLERARVINALTQRLEESQQQCAKLLQTSSVQEMSQIQIKLQQTQSAKALSENMNKGLQEDLADLKEQITLYESAVKHGVITLDLSSDWENQLSESCMDLGLKKANRKNGTLHRYAMIVEKRHYSKLPKDEALRLLRVEMQRCLGSLKGKRQKISQLQEELQHCQSQVNELQTQLDEANLSSSVLEKKNKELKQSEEKVRSANSELCTKMREMIQDLDQEKQEAAERVSPQHMGISVDCKPLLLADGVYCSLYRTQLSEVNDKMLAVQECYISVCKEKDMLEERIRDGEKEEALIRENETLHMVLTLIKPWTYVLVLQVEGAVTRAYNRWTEDLTSLPEYQVCLQTEREKWERLQEKCTEQQVSQALRKAEEQWHKKHKNQLEEQSSGAQRVEELQEEVATLQSQLEQVRREQAALLKAELAGARAVWNRDKQQEISVIQVRSERVYQTKLQDQHKKLEQALQQSREEADLQKKELLLQMEAKLRETLRAREEDWSCQHAEKELTQRQQIRDEILAELQTGLAEVQAQLLRDPKTDQQGTESTRRTSGATSETTLTHIIQTSCSDIVSRVISQAKTEWKKYTMDLIDNSRVPINKFTQQYCPPFPGSLSQRKEQAHCRKECTETLSKLQKKNQELHRHLEKACRQLQHSVREHKTAMQHLKEDMLRYLQESRERAAEMICMEVQRERQDTARKMRRYYLTCLQELLQDGGKTTGAEKKIMNAASKLAAMAKVLETPIRSKSGKNCSLPSESYCTELHYCGFFFSKYKYVVDLCFLLAYCSTAVSTTGCPPGRNAGFIKNLSTLPEFPDIGAEGRSHMEETSADSEQKPTAAPRTKPLRHQDISASAKEEASVEAAMKPQTAAHKHLRSYKPQQMESSHQVASPTQVDFVTASVMSKNRELYLQGGASSTAVNRLDSEQQSKPFPVQEAPVRDEKRTDWSMTSSDSDTSFQVPRLSCSGRKVEPVKPFSVSAASASDLGEFGGLTPDASDLTIYNEIAQKTPRTQTLNFPSVKMSTHRQPTPGSEAEKQQGVCSRPLFSELRRRQQDSGFDSPFYQQK
uniref:Centrosomal protein 152 n=1 Tax=Seriola lalandi dorsalis TaxID=1841481 RepID=A0A3B4WYJ8_SERLL